MPQDQRRRYLVIVDNRPHGEVRVIPTPAKNAAVAHERVMAWLRYVEATWRAADHDRRVISCEDWWER